MQLTAHQLRFTVEAETTIQLNAFKGSALRGAWQSHLRTLYCGQADPADALHQSLCPVCYLLSRETGSGDDRRPYALKPPLTEQDTFQPGDRFQFDFTLFGQAAQFIPYVVLAVGQMGQSQGLGRAIHPSNGSGKRSHRHRGAFRLVKIEAINELSERVQTVLAEGETMVQMPAAPIDDATIEAAMVSLLARMPETQPALTLTFLTPTRIIRDEQLVKQPDFEPFFARLIQRLSALQAQFVDQSELDRVTYERLMSLAAQVRLVADQTHWQEVKAYSTRLKGKQWLSGFAGPATYQVAEASLWAELLPWLLWGTVAQVGKYTVKGCGWYRLDVNE